MHANKRDLHGYCLCGMRWRGGVPACVEEMVELGSYPH